MARPPATGARQPIAPMPAMLRAITPIPAALQKRSRITARAPTAQAAVAAPCKARQTSSTGRFGASVQAPAATVYKPSPHSSALRRP